MPANGPGCVARFVLDDSCARLTNAAMPSGSQSLIFLMCVLCIRHPGRGTYDQDGMCTGNLRAFSPTKCDAIVDCITSKGLVLVVNPGFLGGSALQRLW